MERAFARAQSPAPLANAGPYTRQIQKIQYIAINGMMTPIKLRERSFLAPYLGMPHDPIIPAGIADSMTNPVKVEIKLFAAFAATAWPMMLTRNEYTTVWKEHEAAV